MKNYFNNPMGYIFQLLDISVTHMASSLYVDQGLVSKWKNGSRILKKGSGNYEKVLDYILEQNEKAGNNTLHNLFHSLFPEKDSKSVQYLMECLDKFLSRGTVPASARIIINESKNALYHAGFSVFSGLEGRQNAMRLFLDTVETSEASNQSCELLIMDCEQFCWLICDKQYMHEWSDQLYRILEHGIKVTMIHFFYNIYPGLKILYKNCSKVFRHPNLTAFYYSQYADNSVFSSYYILKGEISVAMDRSDENPNSLYSAVFYDPLTCSQHENTINKILERCTVRDTAGSYKEKLAILNSIKAYQGSYEPIYFSSTAPSFIFIPLELLHEILEQNCMQEASKKLCMEYYNSFLAMFLDHSPRQVIKHVHYVDEFLHLITADKTIHPELSALTGSPVYLTKEQYKKQLMNIYHLLICNSNFEMCLMEKRQPSDELPSEIIIDTCWCKKNLWYFTTSNDGSSSILGLESAVVNVLIQLYDEAWECVPQAYKNHDWVASKLLEILSL